jgi:dTDP-4-dehydrorhamnose reductase
MHPDRALPRILITGCNGQVGFELQRSLAPLGEVIALDRQTCDLAQLDVVRQLVRDVRPDVIVNAAAYTAVDKAEQEADLAHAINGIAPGVLAEEAVALGSLLVHYSTDYVFDGTGTGPYRETDAVNPQSAYGRSKLEGERAIMATSVKALILRTSWVFGAHGGNFIKTMLRLGQERESLRIVADQHGAPTSAALIADITAQIVGRFWLHGNRSNFPAGTYHLAAAGETSWHAYAQEIFRGARLRRVPLKVREDAVEPIATHEYPVPAARPANSRLDTTNLTRTFGVYLPPWEQGLNHVLDQILT